MKQEYFRPTSLAEALKILADYGGQARVIGGGTDLVLEEQKPGKRSQALVGLEALPEVHGIAEDGTFLIIGAAVTHEEAARHPLVQKHAPALAQACAQVGAVQVRNLGTLGGNVVSALPAADAAVALMALDAECEIHSASGPSRQPLGELYAGVGKSKLNPHAQILGRLYLPLNQSHSAYERLAQRNALALPILCVAVSLRLEKGLISASGICVAPAGPLPLRARAAQAILKGKAPSPELFEEAAKLAREEAPLRSSAVRGSKEYRENVLPVLLRRALARAAGLKQGA